MSSLPFQPERQISARTVDKLKDDNTTPQLPIDDFKAPWNVYHKECGSVLILLVAADHRQFSPGLVRHRLDTAHSFLTSPFIKETDRPSIIRQIEAEVPEVKDAESNVNSNSGIWKLNEEYARTQYRLLKEDIFWKPVRSAPWLDLVSKLSTTHAYRVPE